MARPYDLTNFTGSVDLYQMFKASNQLVNGLLGTLLLIGTFLVFFFAFKGFETKKAFAGSAFITAIAALLLRILDFIPDQTMFAMFLLVGVALIWLRFAD